jgi:hypothetical protein
VIRASRARTRSRYVSSIHSGTLDGIANMSNSDTSSSKVVEKPPRTTIPSVKRHRLKLRTRNRIDEFFNSIDRVLGLSHFHLLLFFYCITYSPPLIRHLLATTYACFIYLSRLLGELDYPGISERLGTNGRRSFNGESSLFMFMLTFWIADTSYLLFLFFVACLCMYHGNLFGCLYVCSSCCAFSFGLGTRSRDHGEYTRAVLRMG